MSENVEADVRQLHYMSQSGERNKRVLHSTKTRRIPLKPNFVPVLHLKTIQRFHDLWRVAALLLYIFSSSDISWHFFFSHFRPIKLAAANFSSFDNFFECYMLNKFARLFSCEKTIHLSHTCLIFLIFRALSIYWSIISIYIFCFACVINSILI